MFFIINFSCKLPHEVAYTVKKSIVQARNADEAKSKLKDKFYSLYPDYPKGNHFSIVSCTRSFIFNLIVE